MTETSSSFLGKFFKKVEDEPVKTSAPNPAPTVPINLFGTGKPATRTPTSSFVPDTSKTIESIIQPDPAIQKILEADINEAAKPAFSQFSLTEQSMAGVLHDERTRFQAAAAAIKAQGHTVESVLTDVDECLQALDKKERENAGEAAAARERKIGAKKNQLASINQTIEELQERLKTANQDAAKLLQDIETDEAQIAETEARFGATCLAYRTKLNETKSKIASLTR